MERRVLKLNIFVISCIHLGNSNGKPLAQHHTTTQDGISDREAFVFQKIKYWQSVQNDNINPLLADCITERWESVGKEYFGGTNAIECYKCAVTLEKTYLYTKNVTVVTPMCSKFDESDEYVVDCPYSTMCQKTISKLHLQNGQNQMTVTRGCAPQKDTKQVFSNGRWNQEHSVLEVYDEGCNELVENTMAASVKTLCYCRGNLCNSSESIFRTTTIVFITIVYTVVSLCF